MVAALKKETKRTKATKSAGSDVPEQGEKESQVPEGQYFWQNPSNRELLKKIRRDKTVNKSSVQHKREGESLSHDSNIYVIRTTKHKKISYDQFVREKGRRRKRQ
ncbi:hypothetical protein BBBOND_0100150 [Babesia bigemina]|uniref:Uncharacterized protein n=1 Tax=Babesia bigemina TaxID=5866 RepID=A0A061CYE8_BABBI|nr:hypothetical protein BBBOND_0100150 [Babesia bigemina]CDR93686.1 hypothetical protein BBBOND_0100150 [Babesia bigemina]|eukprot:XP_012765872.1 hypothetical protein BBBOND_0100150 [Babesia bigemina]